MALGYIAGKRINKGIKEFMSPNEVSQQTESGRKWLSRNKKFQSLKAESIAIYLTKQWLL